MQRFLLGCAVADALRPAFDARAERVRVAGG